MAVIVIKEVISKVEEVDVRKMNGKVSLVGRRKKILGAMK